jgi:hypothetical protein
MPTLRNWVTYSPCESKPVTTAPCCDARPDPLFCSANPHRPEVLVFRLVELVEAQAGTGGIDLQVERRRLDSLLLVDGQASEAVGEDVGDAEFQGNRGQTTIFSLAACTQASTTEEPDARKLCMSGSVRGRQITGVPTAKGNNP